jgi:hypothetical protein
MPGYIHEALNQRGLLDAYQQNDYFGTLRVTRAKLDTTKQKRLNQMRDELEGGKYYMNMIRK